MLLTFGYAKAKDAAGLAELLGGYQVDRIIDVRLSPRSRDPRWSNGTRATVEEAGFRYGWMPDLGNTAYKSGGVAIRDIEAVELLLPDIRGGGTLALMCVCYSAANCHRRMVAEELVRRLPGLVVTHL